jgi:hypothetical protein
MPPDLPQTCLSASTGQVTLYIVPTQHLALGTRKNEMPSKLGHLSVLLEQIDQSLGDVDVTPPVILRRRDGPTVGLATHTNLATDKIDVLPAKGA